MADQACESLAELDDAAWSAYTAVVERFETAWQTQGDAAIADFLPAADDPGRGRALLALIKIDQEYRWRAGGRPLVENYLDQWTELGRDDEISAELLTAECLTRAGFDRPVQRAELEQRFPRIAGQIDLGEIEQQVQRETVSTGRDPDGDEWSETMVGLPESVSCDAFLARLTAAGLMTAEAVEECLAGLTERERPVDGRELARRLVQLGKLTAYQARTLVLGRTDPLVLGNYVILEPLGHGGMGLVFKAVHRRMDRIVALKILTPELARTPESLRRFQKEAKAAARLVHPNIVIAYDADEADGKPFLVMEYVDGLDLAGVVRQQGPLPAAQALDCVLQAARGLQYAHEHGVVHRDIKPANLVVSLVTGHSSLVTGQSSAAEDRRQGTNDKGQVTKDKGPQAIVKILDMGLAHLDSGDASRDETTGGGQIMGTVDYMAPEQAIDAHSADGRADIYSLGATLWYLLTGESMLAGRTIAEKLLAHQSGSIPSLADVCPGMPEPVKAIFRRMVAKRPEERYQTMAELIADLESLLPPVALLGTPSSVGAGDQARPRLGVPSRATLAQNRPPWWRDWRKLAAVGGGGLLLIWLAIWIVIRDKQGQEVGRVRLPEGGSVTLEPQPPSPRPGLPVGRQVSPAAEVGPGRRTGPDGGEGPWNLPPDAPPPAVAPFDAAGAKTHQEAWAKYLSVPVEVENSIGMRLVLIPPGEFDMGLADADVAFKLEQAKAAKARDPDHIHRLTAEVPLHRIRITQPFWFGRHEVTRGQFRRFVEDRGYRTEAERDGKGGLGFLDGQLKQDPRFVWNADLGFEQTDEHPVVNVSWNDASAFCAWLSEEEGMTSQLPTEAQWEYACRAGTTTPWYCGSRWDELETHAWFDSTAEKGTHPVGQKTANAWGLCDMHGNVWEWCADWYDPAYYATSPRDDPPGASAGPYRVSRGGGWTNAADGCRAAYRCGWQTPLGRVNCRGFRIARQVQPADAR